MLLVCFSYSSVQRQTGKLVCTAATTHHNDVPAHYEEGDGAHANTVASCASTRCQTGDWCTRPATHRGDCEHPPHCEEGSLLPTRRTDFQITYLRSAHGLPAPCLTTLAARGQAPAPHTSASREASVAHSFVPSSFICNLCYVVVEHNERACLLLLRLRHYNFEQQLVPNLLPPLPRHWAQCS